jgi:hypothetical protein
VVTKENVSLLAEIQGKTIESAKGVYKEENSGYVHVIKFDRLKSGTKISLYAKNVTTNSQKLAVKVAKSAPDAPIVASVSAGNTKITGTVEIFLLNSEKKPTLKNTKTKVFARVDGRDYTGSVKEDGSFVIVVPKIKEGIEIFVYAYNINGYGPEVKVATDVVTSN